MSLGTVAGRQPAQAPPAAERACPACQRAAWSDVEPADATFQLRRCGGCGTCRVDCERPELRTLYESYYAGQGAERLAGPFQRMWEVLRKRKARRILQGAPIGARVCDIGCERGELLRVLQQAGCAVCGTQLSASAAEFARARFGIPVFVGDVEQAPFANGPFDLVLMIHVLEHLPDPERYSAHVFRMLAPGGAFWVEVPNAASWTARLTGKGWLHHDPVHHFWSFTRAGLEQLLRRQGFVVEAAYHLSWEFGPIGCVQSWLNRLPGPRNLVFELVRRGWSRDPGLRASQAMHALLAAVLLSLACVVSIAESLAGQGQIVLVRARKPRDSAPQASHQGGVA